MAGCDTRQTAWSGIWALSRSAGASSGALSGLIAQRQALSGPPSNRLHGNLRHSHERRFQEGHSGAEDLCHGARPSAEQDLLHLIQSQHHPIDSHSDAADVHRTAVRIVDVTGDNKNCRAEEIIDAGQVRALTVKTFLLGDASQLASSAEDAPLFFTSAFVRRGCAVSPVSLTAYIQVKFWR